MKRFSLLLGVTCLFVLLPILSFSAIINVPAVQPTIQAGVDAAAEYGDTVLVAPGAYNGDGNWDIDFHGKGIYLISENGPEVTIIDCLVRDTLAHRGFYLHDLLPNWATIDGFTIQNGADPTPGSPGGGMYIKNTPLRIKNCIFYNNGGWLGGALCLKGDTHFATVNIEHCMFIRNIAGYGAAIFADNMKVIGQNCTFYDNGALHGSHLYTVSSGSEFSNCIFAFVGGGGAFVSDTNYLTISKSDIYGNVGGDDHENLSCHIGECGNFSLDPLFCDTSALDLHLAANSPCLADNNDIKELIGYYDLGCNAIYPCGDFDHDGFVNIFDVTFFIDCLYRLGPCPDNLDEMNINGDSSVNIFDAVYLISFLYLGGPAPICE